jgi:hypothetical protein
MKKPIFLLGSAVLILALISQPVFAEEKDYSNEPWETAGLFLGAFIVDFNSSLDLGFSGSGIGVTVDGEDLNVALEYNFWKYAGVGLGYNFVGMDISKDGNDTGLSEIDMSYGGLLLYAKLYF